MMLTNTRNATRSDSNSSSYYTLLAMSLTTTTLLAVGVVAYKNISKNKKSKNNKKKEYPPLCPLGFLDTVDAVANGKLRPFLIEQFAKCGQVFRIRLYIPGIPMTVVLANPQDIRAVYKEPSTYKPPQVSVAIADFTKGDNIISLSGGADWAHRRKGISPAFAPNQVTRMNRVIIAIANDWIEQKRNEILLQQKESSNNTGITFDVGQEMLKITVSVICKAAMDYDVSVEERDSLLLEFKLGWTEFTTKSGLNPFRKFATWILPERQRAYVSLERIQQFAFRVMDYYKNNPSPTPDTAIDRIMKNTNYKDDMDRASDVIMILFAGHDTTGFTLAYSLLELAKKPVEIERLRRDLDETNDQKDDTDSTGNNKTLENKSPYLKAVITETMRMHPATPIAGFRAMERDFYTETEGYFIPKGSMLLCSQLSVARDPTIFENPFKFEPSRWIHNNNNNNKPSSLSDHEKAMKNAIFPFALDKRGCAGRRLAFAELYSFLPRMVQAFDFSVVQEGINASPGTLRLEDCWLKVTIRA